MLMRLKVQSPACSGAGAAHNRVYGYNLFSEESIFNSVDVHIIIHIHKEFQKSSKFQGCLVENRYLSDIVELAIYIRKRPGKERKHNHHLLNK